MAAIAEAYHTQVVPYNPPSSIGLAACLQIAAAIPNFTIQEYATGFEVDAFETTLDHLCSNIVDHCPKVVDGFVDIPRGPGLDVNLVDSVQQVRPPFLQPIKMRPHRDGFLVDQ